MKLDERIEAICREMCQDLGLDPDHLTNPDRKQWQEYKIMVQKHLEEEAMVHAEAKIDHLDWTNIQTEIANVSHEAWVKGYEDWRDKNYRQATELEELKEEGFFPKVTGRKSFFGLY